MANYYATARTSYTKVKDVEKFKEWVEYGIPFAKTVLIEKDSEEHGELYGMYFDDDDSNGIPEFDIDENDDSIDYDICQEIQPHIEDGWSITFMEVGAEKMRYLIGYAMVVTPTEIEKVSLQSMVSEKLEELGNPLSTECQY